MRLLNVKTLKLETFHGSDIPTYAALSHTWGKEEVTFQDLQTRKYRTKKGWKKILGSVGEAIRFGCNHVWIDTCCIDKTSSAELSEAINSMFRWYRKSTVCFVHLEDIIQPDDVEHGSDDSTATPPPVPDLSSARWFTRGWTLQELIAPPTLYFYDKAWKSMGTKDEFAKEIAQFTGIDLDVLQDYRWTYTKSIARRMSWASDRETTRLEDVAYSLMGIFKVNMPLLYGEGENAFIRLQEEIMRSTYDHSLFAWGEKFSSVLYDRSLENEGKADNIVGVGFLAPHPEAFRTSAEVIAHSTKTEPYYMTNKELQIHVRLLEDIDFDKKVYSRLVVLQCGYKNKLGTAIAIPVHRLPTSHFLSEEDEFYRTPDERLEEVEYDKVASLESRKIYVLGSGVLLRSQMPTGFHRCWLRERSKNMNFRLQKARACKFPPGSNISDVARPWNYKNSSITWPRAWDGARIAILLSKKCGPAFVIIATFTSFFGADDTKIDVYVKQICESTQDSTQTVTTEVKLEQVLKESLATKRPPGVAEAKTTFLFDSHIMTAQVKKEAVFDESMFVLNIFFQRLNKKIAENPS